MEAINSFTSNVFMKDWNAFVQLQVFHRPGIFQQKLKFKTLTQFAENRMRKIAQLSI